MNLNLQQNFFIFKYSFSIFALSCCLLSPFDLFSPVAPGYWRSIYVGQRHHLKVTCMCVGMTFFEFGMKIIAHSKIWNPFHYWTIDQFFDEISFPFNFFRNIFHVIQSKFENTPWNWFLIQISMISNCWSLVLEFETQKCHQ